MFAEFFAARAWASWAWGGMAIIVGGTWGMVQLDVWINEWFGEFYNVLQKALAEKDAVSSQEFNSFMFRFARIAAVYVFAAVILAFYTKHWTFRWRTAMNDHYMAQWPRIRRTEGASQRVQEDTSRFAKQMEDIGSSFVESILTLISFLPLLWRLSKSVHTVPILGEVEHALVYLTVIWALIGTVLLALVGIRLPQLEFKNQLVEAAYRKELVYGEDLPDRASPAIVASLFDEIRSNYFRLYFGFLYFDVARYSYLQFGVVVPYLALGPTISGAAITLGEMQQMVRAFGRVEQSFQFFARSWPDIVELTSIYQRLCAFERTISQAESDDRANQAIEMAQQMV